MNISHLKNKNIHLVECENWQDVYGYEKAEMKEDTINYIEQLQQENEQLQQENEILKEDIKDVDIWNKFYPDFLDLYLKIKNEKERSNSKNE